MGKVLFAIDAEKPWEGPSADWQAKYDEGDAGLRFKRLFDHAADMPNMQRTEYLPGHSEPLHSHPEDEVIFVLAGEIHVGQRCLTFGDAIYVARDTTYALHTGAKGCSFLRVGLGDLSAPGKGTPS